MRTEDKTSVCPSNASAEWLSLATSGRSVPVLGHFCPGASLSPEECRGGGDLETFPQLRMNGCPTNILPLSLSYSLFSRTEEKQKSATNPSLCIHFFSLSRESLHPLVRVLSLTSSILSLHSISYIRPSFLGLVCGFDHQLNKLY